MNQRQGVLSLIIISSLLHINLKAQEVKGLLNDSMYVVADEESMTPEIDAKNTKSDWFYSLGYNHYIRERPIWEISFLLGKELAQKYSLGANVKYRWDSEQRILQNNKTKYLYGGIYVRHPFDDTHGFVDASLGYGLAVLQPYIPLDITGSTIRYIGGIQSSLGVGLDMSTYFNWSLIVKAGVNYSRTLLAEANLLFNVNGQFESIEFTGEQEDISFIRPYIGAAIEF